MFLEKLIYKNVYCEYFPVTDVNLLDVRSDIYFYIDRVMRSKMRELGNIRYNLELRDIKEDYNLIKEVKGDLKFST